MYVFIESLPRTLAFDVVSGGLQTACDKVI